MRPVPFSQQRHDRTIHHFSAKPWYVPEGIAQTISQDHGPGHRVLGPKHITIYAREQHTLFYDAPEDATMYAKEDAINKATDLAAPSFSVLEQHALLYGALEHATVSGGRNQKGK